MHGIKRNKKKNDYKYKANRKLNDNNTHQYISRYAVVVDGVIDSFHSSEKKAHKYVMWLEESFYNQDEPIYPRIEVIREEMEMYYAE